MMRLSSRRPCTGMRGLLLTAGLLGASTLAQAQAQPPPAETALDRYVAKPEEAYRWELAATLEGEGWRALVLDLTSQTWRSAEEVDRTEWRHWLTVVVPDEVRHSTAMLWIGGGNNGSDPPRRPSERSLRIALATGSVVADLANVPNQPLTFADSHRHARVEDDLIAYGRIKYLASGDEEWLVRLPMVKSGVGAMDAIQELTSGEHPEFGDRPAIERFVVGGGSKRGWTTWLVGAVDERVAAIAPLVIDALNTEEITRHHFAAYGHFSRALGDYVRHGLYPHLLGTEGFARILAIEDPYLYRHRERLRIPKYVVNASGDQYFLPDNSRFYFQAMPDEKHLRYVPNAKHDLEGSNARDGILAWYRTILEGAPRPRLDWTIAEDGTIEVRLGGAVGAAGGGEGSGAGATPAPRAVRVWQATNPERRDFRLDTIGPSWTSEPLEPVEPGVYRASLPAPERGWRAFFVELEYDGPGPEPLLFSTDVSVVPDTLPYSIETHTGPWLERRE
ncbi:MAG TPA: PhoPQ-activated protein PqaA family protein [Thermoanaerobaculia bacterium]|nr:PhoPQ-activated protein PqaA family protein [Thermoanaerobaculia bacterium]